MHIFVNTWHSELLMAKITRVAIVIVRRDNIESEPPLKCLSPQMKDKLKLRAGCDEYKFSIQTSIRIYLQGVFFHWYPPKKLKYGKPRLGESTLT